jgi:hypothetical protein
MACLLKNRSLSTAFGYNHVIVKARFSVWEYQALLDVDFRQHGWRLNEYG